MLIQRVTALQTDSAVPAPSAAPAPEPARRDAPTSSAGAPVDAGSSPPAEAGTTADAKPAKGRSRRSRAPKKAGQILVESGLVTEDDVTLAVAEQELGDGRRLGEILAEHGAADEDVVDRVLAHSRAVDTGAAPPEPVAAPDPTPASTKSAAAPAKAPQANATNLAAATVRVDVRLLDELMTLVGELVLARNQIMEYNTGQRTPMAAAAQRLDLITTELQARVMTTRMQPIGTAWNRFPRVVRDVSAACGKQVRLELVGAETELDRSLIESITDPLMHIVRNAVDHGIERPADRVAQGKPAEGRLLLRAYHEDGQVHIEIAGRSSGNSR